MFKPNDIVRDVADKRVLVVVKKKSHMWEYRNLADLKQGGSMGSSAAKRDWVKIGNYIGEPINCSLCGSGEVRKF